jgi:hypothetical protein
MYLVRQWMSVLVETGLCCLLMALACHCPREEKLMVIVHTCDGQSSAKSST